MEVMIMTNIKELCKRKGLSGMKMKCFGLCDNCILINGKIFEVLCICEGKICCRSKMAVIKLKIITHMLEVLKSRSLVQIDKEIICFIIYMYLYENYCFVLSSL